MNVKSVVSVLVFLAACFTVAVTQSQPGPAVSLTGRWSANDGGTYYLRQVGSELWWYGQSGDGGQSWSNVYQGTIQGEQITGSWADVPHGRIQSSGVMSLAINNPNQLTATNRTGGFGGSVWTRQGAVAVTPPPPATQPPQPTGSVVQLDGLGSLQSIRSVASQSSDAFKRNLRTDLAMQTSSWDKTPYTMYESAHTLILRSPRKIVLSGNEQGTAGWSIDNFLLLEVFNSNGQLLKRVVIGNHEPVLAGGVSIEKVGADKQGFAAGEIDITRFLPVNSPFVLRASAVDYGGVGNASNVFLTLEQSVAVTPPPPAGGAAARYIGCYKDQGDPTGTAGRDLSGAVRQDGRMTTQMCASECRAKGFAYASTQYSTWCFCGNSYGNSGTANNCDMACGGSAGEMCGGAWANSVYQVGAGGASPPAAGGIRVLAGTYGANCGQARGNKTAHLATACNGRDTCEYVVNHQVIGDPAVGCAKNYTAEWQCTGASRNLQASAAPEAGYGSKIMLSCRN